MEQNENWLVFGIGYVRLELRYLFESNRRRPKARQNRVYTPIPLELFEQVVKKKDSMPIMPGSYCYNLMIYIY